MKDTSNRYTISEKNTVQKLLLSWFDENQRNLPWRAGYDPYHVWISEIMGQQTQMDRVVQYYNRWMGLFPDVSSVAEAGEQEILKAWEGLGYYSRAKNIRRTAQVLMEEHDGKVPADPEILLALPGVGPYTAAAILSIAYNKPFPVLDANVERVFARLLDLDQSVKAVSVRKKLQNFAKELLPDNQARFFNQALMELGALVCRPKSPKCNCCPLTGRCQSRQRGTINLRPVRVPKAKTIEIVMACGIIVHEELIFVQQRLANDVWGSLWEFPGGRLKEGETPQQAATREILEETELTVSELRPLETVVHHYTKYRVTLHGFTCRLQGKKQTPVLHAASQYRWVSPAGLRDFPFPAGHRRLIEELFVGKNRKKRRK